MRDVVRLVLVILSAGGCSLASVGQPSTPTGDAATSPLETTTATSLTASTSPRAPSSTAIGTPRPAQSSLPPIDTSIEPVSLSKPSAEAAEALRICQVLEYHGADKVGGMGRIPHARDAIHYAPLTGKEPEIDTDDPTWLITFRGELQMPMLQQVWIDPTCVVVGDAGGVFATGPIRVNSTGVTKQPPANCYSLTAPSRHWRRNRNRNRRPRFATYLGHRPRPQGAGADTNGCARSSATIAGARAPKSAEPTGRIGAAGRRGVQQVAAADHVVEDGCRRRVRGEPVEQRRQVAKLADPLALRELLDEGQAGCPEPRRRAGAAHPSPFSFPMQLPQWSGVIAQPWPGSSFTTDSVLPWNCASRVSRRPSIPTADGPAGASGSAARRQLPDAAFAQEYPESDLKAIRRPGDRCSRPRTSRASQSSANGRSRRGSSFCTLTPNPTTTLDTRHRLS